MIQTYYITGVQAHQIVVFLSAIHIFKSFLGLFVQNLSVLSVWKFRKLKDKNHQETMCPKTLESVGLLSLSHQEIVSFRPQSSPGNCCTPDSCFIFLILVNYVFQVALHCGVGSPQICNCPPQRPCSMLVEVGMYCLHSRPVVSRPP